MKRLIRIVGACAIVLLLSGVLGCGGKKSYQKTFYSLFETVSTLTVYADSEEDFEKAAKYFEDELTKYHRLFDIYNNYDGINNLKTINDYAGIKPVAVDEEIIDLLKFCREMYEESHGEVNVAFGAVLSIWHDYREAGMENPEAAKLPPMKILTEAAAHTKMEDVVIDEANQTVYLKDSAMRLDVGAIAKGYAVEKVGESLKAKGISNALIDVGGNIKAIGKKADGNLWRLGLQNPNLDSEDFYIHTIALEERSLVTSGNYQRYYTVDGKRYHHIIKPETLMPDEAYTSVSVICDNSGIGDGLSTALFNMSVEDGKALAKKYNAAVLWVKSDGSEVMFGDFEAFIDD